MPLHGWEPKENTQNTAKSWKTKNMFDFWNAILRLISLNLGRYLVINELVNQCIKNNSLKMIKELIIE